MRTVFRLTIMTFQVHLRRFERLALAALLLSAATAMVAAPPASMRRADGQARSRPAMNAQRPGPGPRQGGGKGNQEHLPQWMARHSDLSPAEQQRALENEPGFRDLPPQTQQRLRNQLAQLNNMSPEQRRRTVEHTEAMERLTPSQREQFRGAMQQYSGLPEDRRRLVARSACGALAPLADGPSAHLASHDGAASPRSAKAIPS